MRDFFGKHRLAILAAIAIGLIYGLPQIFFIVSLGDAYHGIPMIQTPNEDSYLARIQDILDGHPALGSAFFYEYKDQWPLSPPVGEMFYAIPAFLLGVPAKDILVASKFILPFILFLLAYILILYLSEGDDFVARKINAVAGALFITLGYDLIDYRNLWRLIMGQTDVGGFLLWARPVNPILGAIFLFSFLIFVWKTIRGLGVREVNIFGASVSLALMMASYFFSWGIALSVLAMLIFIYLIQRKFQIVKNLIYILPVAILLASPYWYSSWQASKSPWYAESVLRSGLFLTHYPLLNKLMLLTALLFIAATLFAIFRYTDKPATFKARAAVYLQDWHWFCLALILGPLWAYSQQIITGRTIWPYHFVQYSIPLVIIVAMTVFYNIVRRESALVWRVCVFIIIAAASFYGIYVEVGAYRHGYAYAVRQQSYAPLFAWLNLQEKDCVVLVRKDGPEDDELNVLIPALSHCNRYSSDETFSLMPNERPIYNYMATLRLQGVAPDAIDDYISQNRSEAAGYLFSNWQGLFDYPIKDFPDFPDKILEARLKKFPEDYKNFVAQDFESALKKYKIDYIFSVSALAPNIAGRFRDLKLVFTSDNLFVYQIPNGSQ